jgi:hypothetical protein
MDPRSTPPKHSCNVLTLLDGSSRLGTEPLLSQPYIPRARVAYHALWGGFLTLKRRNASLRRFRLGRGKQAACPALARRTSQPAWGATGNGAVDLRQSDSTSAHGASIRRNPAQTGEERNRLPGPTSFPYAVAENRTFGKYEIPLIGETSTSG